MKKSTDFKKIWTFLIVFMLVGIYVNATVHPLTNDSESSIYDFTQNTAGYDDGDTILLTSEGTYVEPKSIDIFKSITIIPDPSLATTPIINFYSGGFRFKAQFVDLILKSLKISGYKPDNTQIKSELITLNQGTFEASFDTIKSIRILDCEIYGIQNGIKMSQFINTIVDTLIIDNVLWHDKDKNSASPIIQFGEKGTAKYMSVTNSSFYNCGGSFMDSPLFEGKSGDGSGRVGKLVAKKFIIDHNTFFNILTNNGSFIALHAVTDNSLDITVSNNIVSTILDATSSVRVFRMNADAGSVNIKNNCFHNFTPSEDKLEYGYDSLINYANVTLTSNIFIDPAFNNPSAGLFYIPGNSGVVTAGTDGGVIGDPRWEPVPGVYIVELTEEVAENNDVQLTAIVNLGTGVDPSVTWSVVPGTGTATINSVTGLLSPITAGTIKVFATSNHDDTKSDSLEITIVEQIFVEEILISTIHYWELDPSTTISDTGYLKILVTLLPLEAHNKSYTVTLSDDRIAYLSHNSERVYGKADGNVWIIVTADDNNATKDSVQITITNHGAVHDKPSISNASIESISIMPNPASDIIWIQSAQLSEVTITNLIGKVELQKVIGANSSLDIQSLKPGLYIVNIKTGKKVTAIKLLKQ